VLLSKNSKVNNIFNYKRTSMKIDSSAHYSFFVRAFLISLIALPGCSWFSSEEKVKTPQVGKAAPAVPGVEYVNDGSTMVISMNGKPIVTERSLDEEYQQLLKDNPQIEQMLPLMGGKDGLLDRLTAALADRAVLRRFIVEEGISSQSDYQVERDRMIKSVTDMLNVKYFNKKYAANVSEREVRDFYEKNKDTMPELVISRGGVQASGVKFSNEADAKAFLTKLKAAKNDLGATAKEAGLTDQVQDFQIVNNQSMGIPPALREKITAMERFPAVELVKVSDNEFWVIKAASKEDTVYREYEHVKDNLKRFLEDSKREEIASKAINELKEKYGIKVEKVFAPNMPNMPGLPMMEEMEEEEAGMPQEA
jgi:hypothetical protein